MRRSALCLAFAVTLAAPALAEAPPYTEQGFMDAAFNNCAKVEGRPTKSCECEQMLIKERLAPEDKEMAYYYWVDQAKYAAQYKARTAADPKWPEAFTERFTTLQALILAACGR
jgi:hypothetical protein